MYWRESNTLKIFLCFMVNELSQYDILHLNKSGLGNIEFNNYGTYGNKGYS